MTRQIAYIGGEDRRERYVLRSAFEGVNLAGEALYPNSVGQWTDANIAGVAYARMGDPIDSWAYVPGLGGIKGSDLLALRSSRTDLGNSFGTTYSHLGYPIGTWAYIPNMGGVIEAPDRLTFQSSGTSLPNAFVVEADPPYRAETASVSRAVESASARESVRRAIDRLFVIAESENFEDGMESNLTIGLATVLRQYPRLAFGILKGELSVRRISRRVLTEVLHFLGRFKGRGIADEQYSVVSAYLHHGSPVIRDAAAVGLSYMRDKRAIPVLEKAIANEKADSLRRDMEVVLAELKM